MIVLGYKNLLNHDVFFLIFKKSIGRSFNQSRWGREWQHYITWSSRHCSEDLLHYVKTLKDFPILCYEQTLLIIVVKWRCHLMSKFILLSINFSFFFFFFFHHRLSEFKTAEKYGQDIMEKINERNQIRRNGGNYSKVIQTDFSGSMSGGLVGSEIDSANPLPDRESIRNWKTV